MTWWDNQNHNWRFQSLHSPQKHFSFEELHTNESATIERCTPKAACVFSWLRPNGILPWLSESGKQSSHWGSRPCGHSCGTDPLSLLWLRSSHGLLWSGSLRCPRQPDSTENSASPLVAGSSSWMPHVSCFVSDLHAEIFFLFVCCETCLALFCNH